MKELRKSELASFESLHWERGLPASFAKLFFNYYPEYFEFSFSLVENTESARQLAMEAFFMLWKKREDVTGLANCKTFLYNTIRVRGLEFLKYLQEEGNARAIYKADKKNWPMLPPDVLVELLAFAEGYKPSAQEARDR